MKTELYISVDVESDGPIPGTGDYSMLSFGACVVGYPTVSFYRELKPISDKFNPEALAVCGLDRDFLIKNGADPKTAMQEFANWLDSVCGKKDRPVFVGFNATYDWMFIHWYFTHFLGKNPFGISGWDIKAYYAGLKRVRCWAHTSKRRMDKSFLSNQRHTHNALDDAREQAEIFLKLRQFAGSP